MNLLKIQLSINFPVQEIGKKARIEQSISFCMSDTYIGKKYSLGAKGIIINKTNDGRYYIKVAAYKRFDGLDKKELKIRYIPEAIFECREIEII